MSKTLRLTATIVPDEEGWYVARCLQVEVASQGRTVDEALSSLREALELYLEDGVIPEAPQQPIVAPIEIRLSA
ncbi:type II toxin-antitoxin system HicB family antitoxin [Sphaerimonospora thailandensis]|uniref:HicB family protein n=1 Tax=Sphaerimonospora thailandensis TaxID=795644 RepID=A0A8J3R8K5_9ACTN|nr:type II toxin-antitoxin system HicB family antitoxin [Sphaerimonospora thailandensis]GIH69384.1 HicB family protein [Sphaerimonospora thailandensis]